MDKLVVVGQGYVGLPISMAAAKSGYKVIGFDIDSEKVRQLNSGKSHIEDVTDQELKDLISGGNYTASNDPTDLANCEIAIIAVPTPLDSNRKPDLSYLISAAEVLGTSLLKPSLIINESTSYPGTLREIIKPTVEKFSPKKIDHKYAISPERVDPGNSNWSIKNTPRLFAGLTPEATKLTHHFYSRFCQTLVETSSPEIAEAAKLFENTFRQVNIALVNELALITRSLNLNVHEVIAAAATKPYGFMEFKPGLGVGGHCIPVDPSYLAHVSEKNGIEPRFINLANQVNLEMPSKVVARIKKDNGIDIKNKKILIVGMSYKANVSDVRESPSIQLLNLLRKQCDHVFWLDPEVSELDGEKSYSGEEFDFDIAVIAISHDSINFDGPKLKIPYILDCTGKLAGVNLL